MFSILIFNVLKESVTTLGLALAKAPLLLAKATAVKTGRLSPLPVVNMVVCTLVRLDTALTRTRLILVVVLTTIRLWKQLQVRLKLSNLTGPTTPLIGLTLSVIPVLAFVAVAPVTLIVVATILAMEQLALLSPQVPVLKAPAATNRVLVLMHL